MKLFRYSIWMFTEDSIYVIAAETRKEANEIFLEASKSERPNASVITSEDRDNADTFFIEEIESNWINFNANSICNDCVGEDI